MISFLKGNCQKCTRGQYFTSAQNCTNILLHEDTFARADNFARRHFCTDNFICFYFLNFLIIKSFMLFYLFFYTITFTPNSYFRLVSHFLNSIILKFYFVFTIIVTPNPRSVAFFLLIFVLKFIF